MAYPTFPKEQVLNTRILYGDEDAASSTAMLADVKKEYCS